MLRVYSFVVLNRRAQMSPRAYIYRLTCIACCGSRPPRQNVAARIYIYGPAGSCVCDVIVCVLVLARIIHMSPRARVHMYRFPIHVVGGSDVATRLFKSIAMCASCVAITRWRCAAIAIRVALTRWFCVAIAPFYFWLAITIWLCVVVFAIAIMCFSLVVSQSLYCAVSQSPFLFLFLVSQSLYGVVSQSPCLFPFVVSQSLIGVVSQSPRFSLIVSQSLFGVVSQLALCARSPFLFSLVVSQSSSALCRNLHFLSICAAITLWRCVAIAIFLSLCRNHYLALCRNRFCFFIVSQSLFCVVSQSPLFSLPLCRNHYLALCRNRHFCVSQSLLAL